MNSITVDTAITYAQFDQQCTGLGGVLQTHAVCAGNVAGAGLSFNKWSKEMIDHSCKGLNTCGGISCVLLPADAGRDPVQLYKDSCGDVCHSWEDPNEFMLNVPAGTDPATAIATFQGRSDDYHVALVAFGRHDINGSGDAAANMPAFFDRFSRAEILGMLAHVATLTPVVEEFSVVGVNEDLNGPLP
ncbi:MAG: hypothetical protein ABMB14_02000 [Myxococcota bacterium]